MKLRFSRYMDVKSDDFVRIYVKFSALNACLSELLLVKD